MNNETKKNIEKIESFKDLKKGWYYDNNPIPINVIEKTKKIIETLDIQPDVFPTGAESIQIEYEKDNYYLEFEIYEHSIGILELNGDTEIEYEDFPMDSINDYVNEFHKKYKIYE